MLATCPDCHHTKPDRQPVMYCLKCERAICQQCSRAHPGAVVAPEESVDATPAQ